MRKRKVASLLMAVLMLTAMLSGIANALQATDTAADEYVSLHQYTSTTDTPNVYKITQTVQINIEKPAVFITFLLDDSTSMQGSSRPNQGFDIYAGGTSFISRRQAVSLAMKTALDTLKDPSLVNKLDSENIYVSIMSEGSSGGGAPYSYTGTATGVQDDFAPLYTSPGVYNTDIDAAITAYEANVASSRWSHVQAGAKKAYDNLLSILQKASGETAGWPNQTVNLEKAKRYIMILSDGDMGNNSTQALNHLGATKLASEYDSAGHLLPATSMAAPNTGVDAFGETHALGATVWTTVFGSDGGHRPDWANTMSTQAGESVLDAWDSMSGTNATFLGGLGNESRPDLNYPTYWRNSVSNASNVGLEGNNDNYRVVEPFMAAASRAVRQNQVGGYPTTGTYVRSWMTATPGPVYASEFRPAVDTQTGEGIYSNGTSETNNTHYFWIQHIGNDADLATNAALSSTYIPNNDNYWASHTTISADDAAMTNTQRSGYDSYNGQTIFKEFIEAATATDPITAQTALTQYYDLYQMPGHPLIKASAADGSATVQPTVKGKAINWDIGSLENGVLYTLEFYIKMADGLDASLSYPISDTIVTDGATRMTFPQNYISPAGKIEEGTGDPVTNTGDKTSGYDGHQENRENAKSTTEYTSYTANITPIIKGVKVGTGVKGRVKAIVEVDNGSYMRYQWQVKNESGNWEDVFGATSSQYTLGYQFKAGENYELRCKITNPAGGVTFSDTISITAVAQSMSEELQSK